ncbi:MAG TPA: DUF1501 domain-containing protein [Pirellulales bacterium]|nr:DUF1501 domain-containing protein [Pirellulales bacterium]
MHTPAHSRGSLSRRQWMQLSTAGFLAGSMSGWFETLANDAAAQKAPRGRSCILLWMSGGPSQMDTFDLKPGHPNGGQFKQIETAASGLKISEHLPLLAKQGKHLAVLRSLSTKEGDHSRATYLMRNGYLPQGPIRYPTLGSLVAKELGRPDAELPNFVSIAPYRFFSPGAYSSGFLGSEYDPLLVGDGLAGGGEGEQAYDLKVADLEPPKSVDEATVDARLGLLGSLNDRFISQHAVASAVGHRIAYERAVRLMRSAAGKAFDLEEEPDKVRDAYGRNRFGQGCLLARRLVERNVPFIEVTLSGVDGAPGLGWDTHTDNFATVERLSGALDAAWSTLLAELQERGLLETSTIVWMGEFGRTPKINPNGGRDHFPNAWSAVLAGGGVRGGQAIGKTSADGMTVEDRPIPVSDLLATICGALKIDVDHQNISNVGRPIRVVDPKAVPVKEALV